MSPRMTGNDTASNAERKDKMNSVTSYEDLKGSRGSSRVSRRTVGSSGDVEERSTRSRRSHRSVDGNGSVRSARSTRSTASSREAVTLTTSTTSQVRQSTARERFQQRMHSSLYDCNLSLEEDEESVVSLRSSMSAAVRDRLEMIKSTSNHKSKKESGDDALIMNLMQKVRQLEKDKQILTERQKDLDRNNETTGENVRNSAPSSPQATTSRDGPGSPIVTQLQAQLNRAKMKIARLEEEQAKHDDLEAKYQDAQVAIVNLQLNRSIDSTDTADFVSVWTESSRNLSDSNLEDNDDDDDDDIDGSDEGRTAGVPSQVIHHMPSSASIDTVITQSTTTGDSQACKQKLIKLKEFRRRRETQLKELVLEKQCPPTDVQAVIQNLQDELQAAKALMHEQQEALKLAKEEALQLRTEHNDTSNEEGAPDESQVSHWKEMYRDLHAKYTNLEINRAWGEFQLRDRITDNALKFHRRLRHWKEQTADLQQHLDEFMAKQAAEKQELREQIIEKQEALDTVVDTFDTYKRGMEQTMIEFSETKKRLVKLMAQISTTSEQEDSSSNDHHGPTEHQQQALLLQAALNRKEKAFRAPGWIPKTLAAVTAHGILRPKSNIAPVVD